MSVFLGHPVYALSVVLFSLILWTGFGSIASERIRLARAGKLAAWSVASAAYLFALPLWLPPLLVDLEGADLLIRAGVCVLVLTPAGLLMGVGVRPACDWSPRSARLPRRGSGASTELQVSSPLALPLQPALPSASMRRSGSEPPATSWSLLPPCCWRPFGHDLASPLRSLHPSEDANKLWKCQFCWRRSEAVVGSHQYSQCSHVEKRRHRLSRSALNQFGSRKLSRVAAEPVEAIVSAHVQEWDRMQHVQHCRHSSQHKISNRN
jgi:hypothetical protein